MAVEKVERIKSATRLLNRLISYRRQRATSDRIREGQAIYIASTERHDELFEW